MKKGNSRQADPAESLKIKIGSHQVHYLKAGSGAPVVLLHGGASDSRDWTVTMAALSHRYTLYAPDIIGYGLSDRAQSGYYFSDFVEFIRDFNREMGLDSPVEVVWTPQKLQLQEGVWFHHKQEACHLFGTNGDLGRGDLRPTPGDLHWFCECK